MKVQNSLINLTIKALSESVDVNVMEHIANDMIYGYNLHERSGFRDSMAIPNRDAASQIINDIVKAGLYYSFINLLIRIHTEGYKGRKIPVSYLKEIIRDIQKSGYIYDHENKIFVEDPEVRRTRNWGALLHGTEYYLAFLRLDIVGNSKLVRKYPEGVIKKTYSDLRKIVQTAIDKRNGRIWNWEGDGGMVAFYFANKNLLSTYSGMEIINEIFIYNLMECKLDSPLEVRLAVHSGLCEYTEDAEELMKSEPIKKVIEIEAKHTAPNSLTISNTIASSFESSFLSGFNIEQIEPHIKYCTYSVGLE